ncbi:MAG: DUF5017 domain-containing protein [Cyclobacteriaceae bacterium]
MKKFNSNINRHLAFIIFFAVIVLCACEEELPEPTLSVVATPTTVKVGDTVYFKITGSAETFVIYTGERGHNYDSSYLAIAEGQEVDLGSLVLTADSLDSATVWLENTVRGYNIATNNANEAIRNDTTIEEAAKVYEDTIVFDNMMGALEALVGRSFKNENEAQYFVTKDALQPLPNIAVALVRDYFTDQGTYLAPAQGYDTGVPLDKYNLNYQYTYNRPGEFTATVIATNLSNKKYSGSGYKYDRTASASEYQFGRLIRQVTITVVR